MDALKEAVRSKQLILFVGAGVSMSLGLPSWHDLVSKIGTELGFDSDVFQTRGDYLSLAEYYMIKKSSIGALRSWMDREFHPSSIDIGKSEIHRLITKLNASTIYTTNYDRWLEAAYDHYNLPYTKIVNVKDLLNVKEGSTQIVKFHGDFDEDNSIVLTESSYFSRLSFESPLDIKLRADVLAKSVLFLGYSLNDLNIRYLLFRLNKIWEQTSYSSAKPKSYIFLARPNDVQETVLAARGITPCVSESDNVTEGLLKFLGEISSC